MEMKTCLKDILYIALGIFLIIALIIRADGNRVIDSISGIDLGLLSLVFALYVLNLFAKVIRWHLILGGVGAKRTGWLVMPIFLASLAINNSTPGKVGGEPVRAYLLRSHSGTRYSVGVASIFAEKSLDILTILVFALIGFVSLILDLGYEEVNALVVGIFSGLILIIPAIMMMASRRFGAGVIGVARKCIGLGPDSRRRINAGLDRFEGSIERFHDSLSLLLWNRKVMIPILLLDLGIWLNEVARLFLVILALPGNHNVGFLGTIGAVSIANILGFLLPIGSGNAIGAASVLELITGDQRMSASASLIAVATSLWLSIPLGLISLAVLNRMSPSNGQPSKGGADRP